MGRTGVSPSEIARPNIPRNTLLATLLLFAYFVAATPLHAAASVPAATPPTRAAASKFEEANRLYEKGQFGDALFLYESILASGLRSPALYFNLGNAHFRNGDLGRAITAYRRAERLSPRDPDIQGNLRFARDQVQGNASVTTPAWSRVLRQFTPGEWAAASSVLLWVWLLALTAMRVRPAWCNMLRPAATGSGLGFGLGLALTLIAISQSRERVAVVTARPATVHLGPLTESQAAFTAGDGTELRVDATRGPWLQVADRSGRTGWIQLDEVTTVP